MKRNPKMEGKEKIDCFISITDLAALSSGSSIKIPPNETYRLTINYPVKEERTFPIEGGEFGLLLLDLFAEIEICYWKVFEEQPFNTINHGIEDLTLEGMEINHDEKTIGLSVGS